MTRNAVIGKVHRLGLSGRATPSKPQRPVARPQRPARTAAPAAVPARRPEAGPQPPMPVVFRCEAPGSATVLTLGSSMCKWPIGDPSSPDFTFCGKRACEGPYCTAHAQLAYQPAQRRAVAGAKRSDASELAALACDATSDGDEGGGGRASARSRPSA